MKTNKAGVGIALIILGLMTGLGNMQLISGHLVLLMISAGFLGAYFLVGGWNNRASIGFLIPGLIMASIGLFSFIEETNLFSNTNDGFVFLIMLGTSFLLLMPIHTLRFSSTRWGEKYWPVFPGSILAIIGIMGLSFGADKKIWGLVNPIILISIGAFILLKPYLKGDTQQEHCDSEKVSSIQDSEKINLKKEKI